VALKPGIPEGFGAPGPATMTLSSNSAYEAITLKG